MFCPSCGAEYRQGFDTCSDCNVALVAESPRQLNAAGHRGEAVLAWSGDDATQHAQAYAVLERAGTNPHTVNHEDRLFGTSEQARFQIYVAPAMAERAKAALHDPALTGDDWTQLAESGAFELPAEEGPDEESFSHDESNWHPDDATAEAWSGGDADLAAMIAASLRENGIRCRRVAAADADEVRGAAPPGAADAHHGDEHHGDARYGHGGHGEVSAAPLSILVLPEDEGRAKEIVQEIVDATPL